MGGKTNWNMLSGKASETPGAWGSWDARFEVLSMEPRVTGGKRGWSGEEACVLSPGREEGSGGTAPSQLGVKVELGLDRVAFKLGRQKLRAKWEVTFVVVRSAGSGVQIPALPLTLCVTLALHSPR